MVHTLGNTWPLDPRLDPLYAHITVAMAIVAKGNSLGLDRTRFPCLSTPALNHHAVGMQEPPFFTCKRCDKPIPITLIQYMCTV